LAGWAVLQSVVKRTFAGLRARKDVRTNRGYVIDVYVVSNRLPMLKNRKLTGLRKSVSCNQVYILTESVITKFYCIKNVNVIELLFELSLNSSMPVGCAIQRHCHP